MKNRFVLKDKACPSKLFHAYEVSQPETQPSPADLMPQNASSACRSSFDPSTQSCINSYEVQDVR